MGVSYFGKLAGYSKAQRAFYRALRRYGMDEDGALRLIVTSGGSGPNASLTITRVDSLANNFLIAPCGVFLRASNLSGFNVTEPAGDTNVYDPTQHRISYIWNFGDPGYTPRITPNIPTVWRDTNVAYGKSVAHVFNAPGNYTVTCWAFDEVGNWGTATYTFQSGGNAGPILNPDTVFDGTKTICFSPADIFTGKPTGAAECTTEAALNTAVIAAGQLVRVLLRRDETYNFGKTGPGIVIRDRTAGGIQIGAYGIGAAPIINTKRFASADDYTIRLQENEGGQCVVSNLDIIGPWDSTTETGLSVALFGISGATSSNIVLHRCLISGFGASGLTQGAMGLALSVTPGPNQVRIVNDTRVTNWKDYGELGNTQNFAIIGSDFSQNPDALGGIDQGISSQAPTNLGNTHGPFRGGDARNLYFGATSFFSCNGWSSQGNNYTLNGGTPTTPQATVRFTTNPTTNRVHTVHERCSHEGMGGTVTYATFSTSDQVERNSVWDKCLFVGSAYTQQELFFSRHAGQTMRNCYFYRPNVAKRIGSNVLVQVIRANLDAASLANLTTTPNRYYNNTSWIPGPTSNIGTTAPIFLTTNNTGATGYANENNVMFAPDLTVPVVQPAGTSLGTSPLAGFQCQFKGARYNFPPVGGTSFNGPISVTSVREGGAGTVANLEWVSLPYPNYTGLSGGGTGQVTQAMVTGNPTQRHQVSITTVATKRMGDSTLWADADGLVAFDFTSAAIRIQNRTGSSWTSGNIWVQIDLSARLMGPVAGSASPLDVPAPLPNSASGVGARNTYTTGARAREDFFGAVRAGERLTNGTIQAGTADIGAVEVA